MKIYKAAIRDLEDVAVLFNKYRIFYEKTSDVNAAKMFMKDRLEQKDSVIYLAVMNLKVVGFTQLYPSFSSVSMQRVWILNDLYVESDVRGKGIGSMLIEKAIELCKETNAKSLMLQTAATNITAQKLYSQKQFVKDNDFYYYELLIK